MRLSADYLKEAIEKLNETSDSKAADKLGIHRNTIHQYLRGERIMDDFACIMVAEVLGIDGMIVIAAAQMEREKNQARKDVWEGLLKKMGALTLTGLVVGAAMMGSLYPADAKAERHMSYSSYMTSLYYVKYAMPNQTPLKYDNQVILKASHQTNAAS